jgi:hypothetical protein
VDKNEFNSWLAKHQKAYPTLGDWFAALPDQKGTLAIWFEVVGGIDLASANNATMRMIRGVEPIVRFNNWHDTPRFIVEHSECLKREAQRYERKGGPMAGYQCNVCSDSGVIEVFNNCEVREVRNGTYRGLCLHRSARHCGCEAGTKKYAGLIAQGMIRQFNPAVDVRVPQDRVACSSASLQHDIDLISQSHAGGPVPIDEWAEFS